jgi:hypothetical protein
MMVATVTRIPRMQARPHDLGIEGNAIEAVWSRSYHGVARPKKETDR